MPRTLLAHGLSVVALGMALNASAAQQGHEHHEHHEHHAAASSAADPHAHHQAADGADPHAHHGAADGDDPHAHHRAMMNKPAEPAQSADLDLRDRMLIDQDGREQRFVSDVIGDRIVVMDFIYTTCTTVCPVLSAVLGQVQTRIGDRLGDDIALVSVTVDPVRDTPERLKAYAAKHQARDGWLWLTGPKPKVDDVLTGVGAYSQNFEDHPAMVLVGDGRTGKWSRFFGFPSPDRIMEQVDALQAARASLAAGG